jgi:hypothetical protein
MVHFVITSLEINMHGVICTASVVKKETKPHIPCNMNDVHCWGERKPRMLLCSWKVLAVLEYLNIRRLAGMAHTNTYTSSALNEQEMLIWVSYSTVNS